MSLHEVISITIHNNSKDRQIDKVIVTYKDEYESHRKATWENHEIAFINKARSGQEVMFSMDNTL